MFESLPKKVRFLFVLTDNKVMAGLALLIGVADGVAAAVLIKLINQVTLLSGLLADKGMGILRPILTLLVPAFGGLAAGLVIQRFNTKAEKTGVVEVAYALKNRDGHIPESLTLTKIVASAFTVGSGGAVGPEAPVVLIGAGVGSWFAHLRHLPSDLRKTLVAAGAAGGLAAVFNTPLSAVVFALEVLLKEFVSKTLAFIVLAVVTASITSHALLGVRAYFPQMSYEYNSPKELFFYFLLGLLCALVAKLFQWIYLSCEERVDRWPASRPVKTMTGGFLMGLLALWIPQVLSDGHLVVDQLLTGTALYQVPIYFLVILLIGKMLATSFTVSTGGSGGTMVPAMFMGAMVGFIFGRWIQIIYPMAGGPGAYGMVGMAAVLAGVTHAPFTAIMMLFELTGDDKIILPLMFTVGVTMLLAHWLEGDTIEHRQLQRRAALEVK